MLSPFPVTVTTRITCLIVDSELTLHLLRLLPKNFLVPYRISSPPSCIAVCFLNMTWLVRFRWWWWWWWLWLWLWLWSWWWLDKVLNCLRYLHSSGRVQTNLYRDCDPVSSPFFPEHGGVSSTVWPSLSVQHWKWHPRGGYCLRTPSLFLWNFRRVMCVSMHLP